MGGKQTLTEPLQSGPMDDPLQRACVSLAIHGDHLVPDELTSLLGHQPDVGVRKGEIYSSANRRTQQARSGLWISRADYREPPCIDKQIADLLNSFPDDLALWRRLTTDFDCYINVGVWFTDDSWTGGFDLEPHTLRMLGERGLKVDFDMYAPGVSN